MSDEVVIFFKDVGHCGHSVVGEFKNYFQLNEPAQQISYHPNSDHIANLSSIQSESLDHVFPPQGHISLQFFHEVVISHTNGKGEILPCRRVTRSCYQGRSTNHRGWSNQLFNCTLKQMSKHSAYQSLVGKKLANRHQTSLFYQDVN